MKIEVTYTKEPNIVHVFKCDRSHIDGIKYQRIMFHRVSDYVNKSIEHGDEDYNGGNLIHKIGDGTYHIWISCDEWEIDIKDNYEEEQS